MSPAKVTLSRKELELVNNADWILTKNGIINKVYELFGQLSEIYGMELARYPFFTGQNIDFRSPKISKGEQYQGLPWVMLDHPRLFTSDDTFSIRSFFWWGNCCSITLQLSGIWQEKYADALQAYFEKADHKGWYIGVGSDPWQHHFHQSNYQPIQQMNMISFSQMPFIKLARKISLHDWEKLPGFFEENFREMLGILEAAEGEELKVKS